MNQTQIPPNDAKQVFKKCGTCSQTFGHILNREFGRTMEAEERALDPLAGGVLNYGHQCGMLWGAALAAGAEAYHKQEDPQEAQAAAMIATQELMESFIETNEVPNCRDITGLNLNSPLGMARLMVRTFRKGMLNSPCFNMAERWAPEAIHAASQALGQEAPDLDHPVQPCASVVAQKMGASEEEATMVAGFSGGIGLSGNACGALGAAIWMKSLQWCKENPGKTPPLFGNKWGKKTYKVFQETTGSKMLCSEICGKKFDSVKDHSTYIAEGGCKEIIEALSAQ